MKTVKKVEQTELKKGDLIRACKDLERGMTNDLESFVIKKFKRGCLLRDVIKSEERYDAGLVREIAEELRLSDKTLYQEHAFAKAYGYSEKLIQEEIDDLRSRNMRISFEHFRKQLNPAKNPDAVGGMENHAEIACKNIENLAGEIEAAQEIHAGNAQVEGAIAAGLEVLSESAAWLVGDPLKPGITKKVKTSLPHYLSWIRSHPCLISGSPKVEAHHVILRSRGNASLDIFTVPLREDIHKEYHALGHAGFEEKYQVDLRVLCLGYITEYITEHR